MSPLAFYRDLIAKGVPEATAYEIAAKFEADRAQEVQAQVSELLDRLTRDVKAEARRAKDRARKAATKADKPETECGIPRNSTESADSTETAEIEKETFSLPLSPQTPLSPTHIREGITTHARETGDLGGAEPETPSPKSKRGTRLPESWEPSEDDVNKARAEGLTDEEITRAATEFRNYWCARTRDATKLNWSRTWHNRIIEIADRKRRSGSRVAASAAQPRGHGRGAVSFADIYARRHGLAAD